jgi:DNA primase (bacterial type)
MSTDLFQEVKDGLQCRLAAVVQNLLPGGRVSGKEYICGSIQGGSGNSCRTNLETGVGSDFATGDSWGDIIGLAAKVWNMRQGEAARELGKQYSIVSRQAFRSSVTRTTPTSFTPLLPVPDSAPEPPRHHQQHGQASQLWRYEDAEGLALAYAVRFDSPEGKAVLPLCYGQYGNARPQWAWKALPEPRPLYGQPKLRAMPTAMVLLVEGEKTADAAQTWFPHHAVLTWSGGGKAVSKTDFSPLQGRRVIIWPDNDEPGFVAALELAEILENKARNVVIVQPPDTLPDGWDLADQTELEFLPQVHIETAMPVEEFVLKAVKRYPGLASSIYVPDTPVVDTEDINIKEWPVFSSDACPGLLGEFVKLATRDSEADPAAITITALVRFCAEVYGYAPDRGPHIYVGETVHPPRLFAVICGNSSKARKGTSRHPVTKLFGREYCSLADLREWGLPLTTRESGGPLSTGEGLAHHVRDETDEERERRQRQNPNEPIREKGDKRLIIQDEEFASGLACAKREGNTLSMGIRCFWDCGDYAPLTKNNPITVKGAHINIVTHITMQELAVCFGDVQAFNGFGNRFLWFCARRSKLVALPSRMPENELAPLQRELWLLVAHAQKRGTMILNADALELWENVYPELSKEHTGLAGSIINRAEAQTIRLALVYALLDGRGDIDVPNLQAALALWQYAQDSARYIFGDRSADPLEEKILETLRKGPQTATELSGALSRNIPKERLQPLLQQLEAHQRITIAKRKRGGRPALVISLREYVQ